jgi:regulator of replication initiation timing
MTEDKMYTNVLNNLLEQVKDLKNEIDTLRDENLELKREVASLKSSSPTLEKINYFKRLELSKDYDFICRMGQQGKTKDGWSRYYDVVLEEQDGSDILTESDPKKCDDGRDGFVAEYLFEKSYVYGSKRHVLIGYLNTILTRDGVLQKGEQIDDFQSLYIDEDESCVDLKLKLILNNGTTFNFPIEIKSIVNGCEGTICTASPMLSYYVIVRLVNPDGYKAMDSFFIMSPTQVIKGLFELDVEEFRSRDNTIWKKTGRKLPSNIDAMVVKSSMVDPDIFHEKNKELPFHDSVSEQEEQGGGPKDSVVIDDVDLKDIKIGKELPPISETGKEIRDRFIEILKNYYKDRRTDMPYDNFIRVLKKRNGGGVPSFEGLRKLTKILKRFGLEFDTKCSDPYVSCSFFEIHT